MRIALLVAFCVSGFAQAQSKTAVAGEAKRPGFALYEGRWRLPEEVSYLKRAAALRGVAATPAAKKGAVAPAKRVPVPQRPPVVRGKRARAVGLVAVRAQHTQLLGFDTVTVSLGTGQARLMLPRTQSVSIGTTVAVPVR
jgi:hypothetical protein